MADQHHILCILHVVIDEFRFDCQRFFECPIWVL